MRFFLYNIRYATGRREHHAWMDLLRKTVDHLPRITDRIRAHNPDVVGLVEVDIGSHRSRGVNQAEAIATDLGRYFHRCEVKYSKGGLFDRLPVFGRQANAILTRGEIHRERFHYLNYGFKRLVIELELDTIALFLVHLSLRFGTRQRQLTDLHDLVRASAKPCVVMGDFNALSGASEMKLFLAATGLTSANPSHVPTYPSWRPTRELDFICYTAGITPVRFEILDTTLSDHLPVVCDLRIPGETGATDGDPRSGG